MAGEGKKDGLFSKIADREGAIKVARDCAAAFWVVAAIQAALSFFIGFGVLIDAAIYTACGYFVRSNYSRFAAVVALILAALALVVTFMNSAGGNLGGGNNMILAVIIAWAAIRSVEATFKIHGRFKEDAVTSGNA